MLTLEELKKNLKSGQNMVGQQFTNARGSVGTVVQEKTAAGKFQASMTCTETGCTNLHVRAQSDWHQSYRCVQHSKGGKKSSVRTENTKVTTMESLKEKQERMLAYAAKVGVKVP